MSLASLKEHASVNCTVPEYARLSFLCCLDASGDWHEGWCSFARGTAGKLLPKWSDCLGGFARDDDALANFLAKTGLGCFAAPGSTTSTLFDDIYSVIRVVLMIGGVLCFLAIAVGIGASTLRARANDTAHEGCGNAEAQDWTKPE